MHEGEPMPRTILPIFGQGVSLFMDRKPKEKMPLIQRKILSKEEVDHLMKKYCSDDAVSTRAKFPLWINSFQQHQQIGSTKMVGQIDLLRKEKVNSKGGNMKLYQQFESQPQLKGDSKTKITLQTSDVEDFRFKTDCQSTTKMNFCSQESGKYLKNNSLEPLLKLKSSQLQMNMHMMLQKNEKKRLQVIELNSSCRAILKGNKNNTSLQSNKQIYPVRTYFQQNLSHQTQDQFAKINSQKKDRQLTIKLNENTHNNNASVNRANSVQRKEEFGCDTADLEETMRAPLQLIEQPYQKRMRATSQKEQLNNNNNTLGEEIAAKQFTDKRWLNDQNFPQTSHSRILKLEEEQIFQYFGKDNFQSKAIFDIFSREEKLKKHDGNSNQSIDAFNGINNSLRDRSRTSYQGQIGFPTNKLILKKDRDLLGMRQISAPDCNLDTDEDEFFQETVPLNVSIQSNSNASEDFDELEQYYKSKYNNKQPQGLTNNAFNYEEYPKIQQSNKKVNVQQKKRILPKIVNLKQGDQSDLQPWEQTAMNSQFLFFGNKVEE